MDKLKQWVALTVVGCLAVLAAGWFLLISPQRTEAEELREQAATTAAGNQTLRTQLAVLKAQAKDLPAQKAQLAAVAAKVPTDPALPSLIRALDGASTEAGVELLSIAPGPPTAVVAPVAPVAPAADGAVPAAPVAAVGPVLQSIPLAVDVVGGYFEVQQFLGNLEDLGRALRVTGVTLAPGTNPVAAPDARAPADEGSVLKASVTGLVFVSAGAVPVTAVPPAPGAAVAVPALIAPAPAVPAR